MSGFTLDRRRTALLSDIVGECTVPAPSESCPPVPWPALAKLQQLVSATVLMFAGADSALPQIWFAQYVGPQGEFDLDAETRAEASANPFWINYWATPCSYPDRTQDFTSVVKASDFERLPEIRARTRSDETPWERKLSAFSRRDAGRHLKLTIWRERGSDFTEADRFCVELLRPHLVSAYEASVRATARREPVPLTRRQIQVMRLVQDGYTNNQIARRLEMAEGTVRTHLNHLYAKLDVTNRASAVRAVFDVGTEWVLAPPDQSPGLTAR